MTEPPLSDIDFFDTHDITRYFGFWYDNHTILHDISHLVKYARKSQKLRHFREIREKTVQYTKHGKRTHKRFLTDELGPENENNLQIGKNGIIWEFFLKGGGVPYSQMYKSEYWQKVNIFVKTKNAL